MKIPCRIWLGKPLRLRNTLQALGLDVHVTDNGGVRTVSIPLGQTFTPDHLPPAILRANYQVTRYRLTIAFILNSMSPSGGQGETGDAPPAFL